MKSKFLYFIFFLIIICFIGMSYAVWQITLKQIGTNQISTGCFNVKLMNEENPILLENAYPMEDVEGEKLVPYTFTITNTCNYKASYQINLEVLKDSTLVDFDFLKVRLNEETDYLENHLEVEKTLTEANKAYKLKTGYLNALESVSYNFRLWLSFDTPIDLKYMSKTLLSKITVISSYLNEVAEEVPIASMSVTDTLSEVVIDASASFGEQGIETYYYSRDGVHFVASKQSSHSFMKENITYGVGTTTISNLVSSKVSEVYLKVEDKYGNQSEIIKEVVGELTYDDTVDKNLRYIGSNPNNYVLFNNELWRIVGNFNNIDDGTGNKETRMKLIRNESIGYYTWDNSLSQFNNGAGINEWSQAKIMKLLNPGYENETVNGSFYWNRSSGSCYNECIEVTSNNTTACDFSNIGLLNDSKNLFSKAVWPLGSNGNQVSDGAILTSRFYELERSENTGKNCSPSSICNDSVERTTKWLGYIGILSPSDYGYAVGGSDVIRNNCFSNILNNWHSSSNESCRFNNWLYHPNSNLLAMTPCSVPRFALAVFTILNGGLSHQSACGPGEVFPALYLKSDVQILSGEGSIEYPFSLSI